MVRRYCKYCDKYTKFDNNVCRKCGNTGRDWSKIQTTVIILVVILIILGIRTFIPKNINPNNFSNETIQCLSEQYKFYGSNWCTHCSKQKQILGEILTENVFIDCDDNKLKCQNLGINAYPYNIMFNKNNGSLTTIPGELSIDKILEYTACK